MTQLPSQPTTTAGEGTWLCENNVAYFSPQEALLSSSELTLELSSGDEQSCHPGGSPNNYSTSPSPVSFPPSPLTTTDSLPSSMSIGYMGLAPTSSPSNVTSISIDGPYPNPLLDTNILEDLTLGNQRYTITAHAFNHSSAAPQPHSSQAIPLCGFDGMYTMIDRMTMTNRTLLMMASLLTPS